MKKLVLLLAIAFVALAANAQRTIVDTIKGAETVNFTAMVFADEIQVLCEDDFGGTSDGLLMLQGSINGTTWYDILTNDAFWYSSIANDSLTIVDNATWGINVSNLGFPRYRITGDGTSGDTTKVTIVWSR